MQTNPEIQNTAEQKFVISRNFSRAANTYDKAAILQQEVGQRLIDRLAFIKIQPSIILDLGGGNWIFC